MSSEYPILLAATIFAARKLNEPQKEWAISDTTQKAEHILKKIDERRPTREQTSVPASQPAQGSQPAGSHQRRL